MAAPRRLPAAISAVNRLLPRRTLPWRLDSPERLIAAAERRAGIRADRLDPLVCSALERLVYAYRTEARLHPVGEAAMAFNLERLLVERLRLEHVRACHPEIVLEPIQAPVFITGLPRTGSTLLHALLAVDPRWSTPLSWQAMFPSASVGMYVTPAQAIRRTDLRFRAVELLCPGFRKVHRLDARAPQECISIQATAFMGTQFIDACHLPGFHEWWLGNDRGWSYRDHRQVLQQFQWGTAQAGGTRRRWLLKAPAHLFMLDALFDVYPDAVLVRTARDPAAALPSIASLQHHLYVAFGNVTDRRVIGALAASMWRDALVRAEDFFGRHPERKATVVDVEYDDLLDEPLGVVEKVYPALGEALTDDVRARMAGYLVAHRQHRHGRHEYDAADFGLT